MGGAPGPCVGAVPGIPARAEDEGRDRHGGKTMSPFPPLAKKSATYDSAV